MIFREGAWLQIPYLIAALIPALTFHEWAHAAVAYAQGDRTAQREGRLTLNPIAHLDVMGTLAIFMIGFGWAKPVPINPSEMKGRWSEFLVAAAGPATNFVLGIFFAVLLRLDVARLFGSSNVELFESLFQISMLLNFALCFFNLIPIGPLDGSRILSQLLPLRNSIQFDAWNMRFGSMILLALIIADLFLPFGILRSLVWAPTQVLIRLLMA